MALLVRPKKSTAKLERFLKLCALGHTAKEAALTVGWKESTGETYRSRNRARIKAMAIERFDHEVPTAMKAIVELTESSKSDATRLAAANRVLEGAGHGVIHKAEVTYRSDDDIIQALLQAFGGDEDKARTLLKELDVPIPESLRVRTLQ